MGLKLPTLEGAKNIDLKDTKTITILIILCIVLFAIIYVWTNKKNTTEGFGQYNINSGDLVSLYGLDNVVVGSSNPLSLTTTLNTLIDARNAGTLSNTYAKNSDLSNTNMNLTSNAISLLSTISSLNNLQTRLTSDLAMVNQIVTSNVAIMNTNLANTVNNSPPSLTVVAYFGSTAPAGWQLCDGLPLMSMETPPQPVHYTINAAVKVLNTPNLLGKFILGASDVGSDPQISTGITKNKVGKSGGAETHKLTVEEMPPHNHGIYQTAYHVDTMGNNIGGGLRVDDLFVKNNQRDAPSNVAWGYQGGVLQPGSSNPYAPNLDTRAHENMPPFYTLIYIIKKPLRGGSSNPISQPSPLFT